VAHVAGHDPVVTTAMMSPSSRTAVVTGAASGIGLAMAEHFASSGMNVVMADVEASALEAAAERIRSTGAHALAVPTDVSDGEQVDALAAKASATFGRVHLLCNNAGVGGGGTIATLTELDWQWVLGVNLWGVIHGLRAFLPGMLAHGEPGHVVNTASMAGFVTAPTTGPYSASKFAVVGLTETLYQELTMAGSPIGVSLLCPGAVNTRIHQAVRNRPDRPSDVTFDTESRLGDVLTGDAVGPDGMLEPSRVAELVASAIAERRFYVFTHPGWLDNVAARLTTIVEGGNPASGFEVRPNSGRGA
jgi:NAD(P)-dependent dehydrogenase (short-subunit alcohol dehydrogenase family)